MKRNDKSYFEWLKSQVEYFDTAGDHEFLFKKLYEKEYYPLIDRDQNRFDDGVALRNEYKNYIFPDEDLVIDTPCSVLEFLVALARRMNYIYARIDEDCTPDMFWLMLENIELESMEDETYFDFGGDNFVDEKISMVLDRTYGNDGDGNLFPLSNPRTNQRNVEVWYQMNQYLNEKMGLEGR